MSAGVAPIKVVAGLIRQNGSVLICQRHRDGSFPLKWEFPGGKVEAGETLEEGLVRELHEELDINAQVGGLLYRTRHDYPNDFSVELFFFYVESYAGQMCNLAFEQISWTTPDRLPTFDFLDGDAAFITLLIQGDLPLS